MSVLLYHGGYDQLNVISSGDMCPVLPSAFRVTRPLGRMVILVILPLPKLILSHASGGSWRALEGGLFGVVNTVCGLNIILLTCTQNIE